MEDDPIPGAARVVGRFRESPTELAGLAMLLAGVLVAGMVWWNATTRTEVVASDAGFVGAHVTADGTMDAPGPGGDVDHHAGDAYDHDTGAVVAEPGGPASVAPGSPSDPAPDDGPAMVVVHVTGAVGTPGVVSLPAGARVADAVLAAGGLTGAAAPELVNLARPLVDGEHVHVLRDGEEPPPTVGIAPGGSDPSGVAGPSAGSGGVGPDGRIDLNRASAAELETLPGIGPARAAAILEHRATHGPFEAAGDLRAVPGIGEVTFQRLAPLVTVG